jgi:hypothetical protein
MKQDKCTKRVKLQKKIEKEENTMLYETVCYWEWI